MADGRRRLGPNVAIQGNVDPGVLFGSKEFITSRINDTVKKAGKGKHILNLGHGIKVGTPEENVAHFFEVAKVYLAADVSGFESAYLQLVNLADTVWLLVAAAFSPFFSPSVVLRPKLHDAFGTVKHLHE
ncbi:hypothetical protein HAX54_050559 [Datura stramonium]|uniref:Uroporphyrinogen decarboxylase (URO-D) domain-containing protein n=1 Tax=Datura stramonium TaxID=4076 RepID=A0ABS8WNM5_DATST|nr:hypothetical protein [Datura stramonium]